MRALDLYDPDFHVGKQHISRGGRVGGREIEGRSVFFFPYHFISEENLFEGEVEQRSSQGFFSRRCFRRVDLFIRFGLGGRGGKGENMLG